MSSEASPSTVQSSNPRSKSPLRKGTDTSWEYVVAADTTNRAAISHEANCDDPQRRMQTPLLTHRMP